MKKLLIILGTLIVAITILTICGGTTTEKCKMDIRAYEFGREMQAWSELLGEGSLNKAIEEYSNGLGINAPYNASNDCVKRGYVDAKAGIDSPYNQERKSWDSF